MLFPYIANPDIEGTAQEKKLYELIWKRTVASQMSEAKVLGTAIRVASDKRPEQYAIQATEGYSLLMRYLNV